MESDHVAVERRLLDAALGPGCVALDAGCGRKTRLRLYRDRIDRLVGIDADVAAGESNTDVDEFMAADLDEPLPFADDSFDLVYANFVVEHLARPGFTFGEWRRVLRPGGALVVVTTNRASPFVALADRLPQRARLVVKRRGAGVAEVDVYPTRYLVNDPVSLQRAVERAGFTPSAIEIVGTVHRYGARVPGLPMVLKALESTLPPSRRSTIVAAFA